MIALVADPATLGHRGPWLDRKTDLPVLEGAGGSWRVLDRVALGRWAGGLVSRACLRADPAVREPGPERVVGTLRPRRL